LSIQSMVFLCLSGIIHHDHLLHVVCDTQFVLVVL